MARSLKKGPYVEPKLLRKIEDMNKQGEKRVIRTWSRASTVFPRWLATPSRYTTAGAMCPST